MPFLIPDNDVSSSFSPAGLLPLWEKLAFSPALPDPFCSGPQWQLACRETFQPRQRIYVKNSSNSLLVLSELRENNSHGVLLPLDADWLFGTTLLGPESPDLLELAVYELAREYYPFLLAIYLSGLEDNALFATLVRRFRRYFHFHAHSETVMCMASLDGGVDGFLSRRSAGHRAKTRRARRGAKAAGIVFERHIPSSPEGARKIYTRLLAVEERSWKGQAQCGMTQPFPCQFYANLIARLVPTRGSRIIIATLDGRDIGFIFGSIGGEIFRGQQFSYASDCGRFSLGHVLQMEMISWLCEEGIRRYDLGPCSGPKMQYKLRWIDQVRPMRCWAMIARA